MTDIIKALEDARGASRELDYRIAYFLGWRFNGFEWAQQSRDQDWLSDEQFRDLAGMAGRWNRPGQETWPAAMGANDPPRYSASLDAALTLVGNLHWQVEVFNLDNVPRAQVAEPTTTKWGPAIGVRAQAKGATPAIALCIAALKAFGERAGKP